MRMGPVFLLVGTAAVVGWFGPDLRAKRDMDEARVLTVPPTYTRAEDARREAWLAGSTALARSRDGHFYADADVSAAHVHFLIDTGASVVVLTGTDARAAGLSWVDADVQPIGRGASGTVYGVPVRLDRIELNGFTAHDVQGAVVPEGLDVSLLGQSFLSRLDGVKIEGDSMTLNSGD